MADAPRLPKMGWAGRPQGRWQNGNLMFFFISQDKLMLSAFYQLVLLLFYKNFNSNILL